MIRCWIAAAVFAVVLAMPNRAEAQATANNEVLREVTALAERMERLEAENAALKERNDRLERRVAELESPQVATAHAPTIAPPQPVPEPAPAPAPSVEPWQERFKVSGYVFGDAYAVLAHHEPEVEDQNGFWIRRGYLTFDARVADEWTARLRLEFNSPGDFETDSKLDPFVKDAYLAWKRGGQELNLGLASSPTFEFVEGFWGHRPVEKTPIDLYRMGSSRDMGVAYKGAADDGKVFYHAMLGNGSGDRAETNEGKKVMAGLGFRPTDGLVAQVYADYEDRPGETDRSTLQAFAGWTGSRSRYGLQYAIQDREVEEAPDEDVAVASAFGVWQLTDRGSLVLRYDRSFDGYSDADQIPYLRIAADTPFDLAILAWEQKLEHRISLIPNIEYVTYRDNGDATTPDDDLYGRVTLYFDF
jgi:regulator of replication initiation timing